MVEASKLATLAFILVPIVIKRAIPWWNKRQARGKKGGATKGLPIPTGNLALPQFAQASPASPFIPYLRYLVAAAFLSYFFYRGYVDQSINLFAQFKLPLSTPTTQVEQLAKQLYGEPLSADMMLLLTRLRSATTRSIYMKVGPEPLGQCTFCNVSQEHFLLYLIPGKLVEYMIAAASVGLLTSQKERMEWRAWVVLPLIVMVIAEAFVLLQDWPKDLAVHLYLDQARYAAFAILTLIATFLPAQQKVISVSARLAPSLMALLQRQELHMSRLHGLAVQRRAIFSDAQLRTDQARYQAELQMESDQAADNAEWTNLVQTQMQRDTKPVSAWVDGLFAKPKTAAS